MLAKRFAILSFTVNPRLLLQICSRTAQRMRLTREASTLPTTLIAKARSKSLKACRRPTLPRLQSKPLTSIAIHRATRTSLHCGEWRCVSRLRRLALLIWLSAQALRNELQSLEEKVGSSRKRKKNDDGSSNKKSRTEVKSESTAEGSRKLGGKKAARRTKNKKKMGSEEAIDLTNE